jgi:hypothetical protein
MNPEKINFRVTRDFGETFNVSVKFIRQNFKLFFQSLIFIAGPFILMSAIAGAFYQTNAISVMSINKFSGVNNPLAQYGLTFMIFLVAAVIANIILIGTVFAFMINYMEKGPHGFTVNDVARTLIKNIGNMLSVFFTLTIIMVIILAVIVGIIIGMMGPVPVFGVLLILGFVIGMIILFPPLIWQLSVVYLVKMQEDKGVFQSYGRTREVMRNNFWWTWVIVVCSTLAIGIAGFIFTLPQLIYQVILMFSHMKSGNTETSIPFMVVATICTFCSTLLYSALYIINGFHYYSLAEKKDGIGLIERINEIGTTPDNDVNQQY